VLAADFLELNLRSVDTLKINYVIIATYSSEFHPNTTLWYDDVVAATSYIGPMVTEPGPSAQSSSTGAGAGGATTTGSGPSGVGQGGSGAATGAAPGEESGGCGCKLAASRPVAPWFLYAAGLLVLLARRRHFGGAGTRLAHTR
jgi:hypothetical protein